MRTAIAENDTGFSLVEILLVMVMITVLSVVFIGQMRGGSVELISSFGTLKSHLRFAQAKAMSTSGRWYVQFDAQSPPKSYALFEKTDEGSVLQSFPGEPDTSVDLAEGISVGDGTVSANLVVAFDRLGRPFTDAAGTAVYSGVRTIVTCDAGTLDITPQTGYIP